METKLGKQIARLRKECKMTQEQLAQAVGVSPPAVSKWETDSSCPDIALLCPLARALHTNVDTLLRFENELPKEKLIASANEIVEAVRANRGEDAEEMLRKLLYTYPSSIPLKYHAAMVLDTFRMFWVSAEKERVQGWTNQKRQLLEEVYRSKDSDYWENAALGLAFIAVQEEDLDGAQELLQNMPEYTPDTTMLWTQLYLKRNEADKALEVIQKRMYALVSKVQTCLSLMLNEKVVPETEKALEICEVYRRLEELFKVGGGFGAGLFYDVYRRAGDRKKMKECLIQMTDAYIGPLLVPEPLLFSPAVTIKTEKTAVTKELKEMLLKALQTEECWDWFGEDIDFLEAVEKLRQDIKSSESL